jgi:hypothetical protein
MEKCDSAKSQSYPSFFETNSNQISISPFTQPTLDNQESQNRLGGQLGSMMHFVQNPVAFSLNVQQVRRIHIAFHSLYCNRQETLKQRRNLNQQQQQESHESKVLTFKPALSEQTKRITSKQRA